MKNEWISLKAFGAFAEISRAIVRIVTLTMLCLTSIVIQIFLGFQTSLISHCPIKDSGNSLRIMQTWKM